MNWNLSAVTTSIAQRDSVITALMAIFFVASCSGSSSQPNDSIDTGLRRDTSECDQKAATQLVEEFVERYNAGQATAAASLFASEGEGYGFQWYSDDVRGSKPNMTGIYDPRDRSSLEQYFEKRHADGDKMSVTIDAYSVGRDELRELTFARTEAKESMVGKAALDCATMKFVLWATGETSDT